MGRNEEHERATAREVFGLLRKRHGMVPALFLFPVMYPLVVAILRGRTEFQEAVPDVYPGWSCPECGYTLQEMKVKEGGEMVSQGKHCSRCHWDD